jgi:hypothetical protein
VQHGRVREALVRADTGSERLRDGKGQEAVRPGQVFVQVVLEPLVGLMLLAWGTVAVATGRVDAVVSPTAGALIEAVSVRAALAPLDGTDDLAVRSGEVGIARQGL